MGDPHRGLGLGLEGEEGWEISAAILVRTLNKEKGGQREAQRPDMDEEKRGRGRRDRNDIRDSPMGLRTGSLDGENHRRFDRRRKGQAERESRGGGGTGMRSGSSWGGRNRA